MTTWNPGYALQVTRSGRISLPRDNLSAIGTVGPGQSTTFTFNLRCSAPWLGAFSVQMSSSLQTFGSSAGQQIACH